MAILFKNVLFILLCMADLKLQKTETFFVIYMYSTIYLFNSRTIHHTFHVKQARIQRGGGGGGGAAEFRTLASLAIILQTVYILPNAMLSMERSSSFLYFPYPNYEIDQTYYPLLYDRAFSYSFIYTT